MLPRAELPVWRTDPSRPVPVLSAPMAAWRRVHPIYHAGIAAAGAEAAPGLRRFTGAALAPDVGARLDARRLRADLAEAAGRDDACVRLAAGRVRELAGLLDVLAELAA